MNCTHIHMTGLPIPQNRCTKLLLEILPLTRSCAALWAADLDWIVELGYSWGGYILGFSQCLALCLRHSARISAGSQLTAGQE